MASARSRFTVAIGFAVLGTLLAFCGALWVAYRGAARAQLFKQASQAGDELIAAIHEADVSGVLLTRLDSNALNPRPVVRAKPELAKALAPYYGVFFVLNDQGVVLYSSDLSRTLPKDVWQRFSVFVDSVPVNGDGRIVTVSTDSAAIRGLFSATDSLRLMLVARGSRELGPYISRVVVGVPLDFAVLPAPMLLGTIFAVAPVIFLLSLTAAYFLAIDAFRPLDALIQAVEDIADGRSLHRRVQTGHDDAEVERLAGTVNAMLERLAESV